MFASHIRKNNRKLIDALYILIVVLVALILTIPVILHGFFDAHDLPFHLKWSKHFAEQFWAGDFYPKWLQKMNAGLGSPAFFFYAPVPYYFTSLFHPFFVKDITSWSQLSLSTALALIASGITAYIWLRSFTNPKPALIASIIYMVLPYHLAIDLYWRFSFAEFWAFVWLPLILYFSRTILFKKLSMIGFAVSYALLIMTHLPTVVTFSAVPISYVIAITNKQQRKEVFIRLFMSLLLGVGLSAIYWLPAIFLQKYISMNAILEKGFLYKNNFLFENYSVYHNQNFWVYLEISTIFIMCLAFCAFLVARTHHLPKLKHESHYWLIVAIVALFMMLPVSRLIWQMLPPVQKIQFPWRFNSVLLVATTALVALAISAINGLKQKTKLFQRKILVIGILLATILVLSNGIIIKQRLKPRLNYDVASVLAISQEDAAEYRPRWVPQAVFKSVDSITKLGKKPIEKWVTTGQGNLLLQEWKPGKIVLQANATTDLLLTISHFYYPGWEAKLKGEAQLLPVQPSATNGLLQVEVPSGRHQVILTLNAGKEERIGQTISTFSVIVTLFLILWLSRVTQPRVSSG